MRPEIKHFLAKAKKQDIKHFSEQSNSLASPCSIEQQSVTTTTVKSNMYAINHRAPTNLVKQPKDISERTNAGHQFKHRGRMLL